MLARSARNSYKNFFDKVQRIHFLNSKPKYSFSIAEKTINIEKQKQNSHPIIVIGCSAIDLYISPNVENSFTFGKTNQASVRSSFGGVGRNISEVIGRLGMKPALITALGKDLQSENIIKYMETVGVDTFPIYSTTENTGKYILAVDKNKEITFDLVDMNVNKNLTFQNIYNAYFKDHKLNEDVIVQLDSEISSQEFKKIIPYLNEKKARIFVEGIGKKILRLFKSGCLDKINQLKINGNQTQILACDLASIGIKDVKDEESMKKYVLNTIGKNSHYKSLNGEQHRALILTRGRSGIQGYFNDQKYELPVVGVHKMEKTNGAGDTFTGVMVSSKYNGLTFMQSLVRGMCGSKITIESEVGKSTITDKLTKELINNIRQKQLWYR